MEFLCCHRDRPGSLAQRVELLEEHWSYMDRYTKEMIARGPTLADDGDTPTGSVHIVDLPHPAAARAFASDEPGYQAGVCRDVLLRRWRNTLGRTMWDFPGGRSGGNRYLVFGLGTGRAAVLAVPPDRDELIAYGPLLSDEGAIWLGTAALVRAPDPETARAILTPDLGRRSPGTSKSKSLRCPKSERLGPSCPYRPDVQPQPFSLGRR
ncbi:YciI family protein [Streptomyces laculatispora]|uniref:YciI family protein n=1 Tax=Streptomyces laculatispora TaxID=887464 RepID=UPI001A95394A|nr:YciI family protein [Streptomyces laculatispora]MBO0916722.1 YciI family protein [Streptomyces laculatispora]